MVFQAQHRETDRDAALKIGRHDVVSRERLVKSLRYEAELLRRVRHPHVVHLFDEGTLDDGTPYLVMELARGHDLGDRLEQCGRLAIPMVVEVGRQLLLALEGLAEVGIVHRDLKPENVMLEELEGSQDGFRVKLIDLGIAVSMRAPWTDRLEGDTGAFAGTPEYVSPQQAQGLPVDARSDLYSLGAVLYECLTGSPPCVGTTPYETLVRVITHEPSPVRVMRSDCPASLEHVVMQALAKDPDARFQSAESMARALSACARISGIPEGADAWRGAPRVASNATAPFELLRRRSADLAVVTDAAIAQALADASPPKVDALPEPRQFERRLPLAHPKAPPRERSTPFVEREDEARWLWPIAVTVLLIALIGAVLGSRELHFGAFGATTPPPVAVGP